MPRAPPGLSLLLMAALAFAATPPLEIINPWLSACDLQPASATDLKGACTAMWGPGPRCPPPCPPNSTQCLLYLEESHKEKVCGLGVSTESRRVAIQKLRMRHCCEHEVEWALHERKAVLQGGEKCREHLTALLEVDALAARISCEYAEVLARYDCGQKYSIKHQCEDCREAYRRWVCSSMVPHFTDTGQRMRPCIGVCQNVEQKCPYLLPGDRAPAYPTQYAGEPTFLCLDPNIPETGEQRSKSSFGDTDCCYTHCGTPGRGDDSLCGNCTGRGRLKAASTDGSSSSSSSSNSSPNPVSCALGFGSSTSTCRLAALASSASPTSTLNYKVLPLWTAWIIIIQINTINYILQCLLVWCANSVRTPLTRFKTKWRRRRPWS